MICPWSCKYRLNPDQHRDLHSKITTFNGPFLQQLVRKVVFTNLNLWICLHLQVELIITVGPALYNVIWSKTIQVSIYVCTHVYICVCIHLLIYLSIYTIHLYSHSSVSHANLFHALTPSCRITKAPSDVSRSLRHLRPRHPQRTDPLHPRPGRVSANSKKMFFCMQLTANVSETTNLILCLGWEKGSDRTEEKQWPCVLSKTHGFPACFERFWTI